MSRVRGSTSLSEATTFWTAVGVATRSSKVVAPPAESASKSSSVSRRRSSGSSRASHAENERATTRHSGSGPSASTNPAGPTCQEIGSCWRLRSAELLTMVAGASSEKNRPTTL